MADKEFVAKQMNRFFQIMAQQMGLDDEPLWKLRIYMNLGSWKKLHYWKIENMA
jgi:hypothetical protein